MKIEQILDALHNCELANNYYKDEIAEEDLSWIKLEEWDKKKKYALYKAYKVNVDEIIEIVNKMNLSFDFNTYKTFYTDTHMKELFKDNFYFKIKLIENKSLKINNNNGYKQQPKI